jgi:hypothetical protein
MNCGLAAIFAVEKQLLLLRILIVVYSLRYQEWTVHKSYFQMWNVRLYNKFPHCIMNEMIFENIFIEPKMRVSIFLQFVSDISLSKKKWMR